MLHGRVVGQRSGAAGRAPVIRSAVSRATPRRVALVVLGSLGLLAGTVAVSLGVGVEHVDIRRAFTDRSSVDAAILFGTRVTRVLLGALVGAALAPAGAAFQALLRN